MATPVDTSIYRYTQLGLTNGKRHIRLRTYNSGPDRDRLQKLKNEGDVITAEEVSGWFRSLKINTVGNECDNLADVLNLIRVTEPVELGFPEVNAPLQNVAEALRILSENLPFVLRSSKESILNADLEHAIGSDLIRRAKLNGHLNALLALTHELRRDPFIIPKAKKRGLPAFWHRDAILLWFILDKHPRTPPISFIKGNDGKGVLLIQKALERTGRSVSTDAIAKAIQATKDKKLPSLDHLNSAETG